MRRKLSLFVNNVVERVPKQWSVIRVKEQFGWEHIVSFRWAVAKKNNLSVRIASANQRTIGWPFCIENRGMTCLSTVFLRDQSSFFKFSRNLRIFKSTLLADFRRYWCVYRCIEMLTGPRLESDNSRQIRKKFFFKLISSTFPYLAIVSSSKENVHRNRMGF